MPNTRLQPVHQGVTMTGTPGLFTGRHLAFPIYPCGFLAERWDTMTHEQRAAYCTQLGFHLEGDTSPINR